uniref:Integrase catalytic domain-containing protein n=1 Tax=Mycena chlorophos TaxID=658473 RepID=A0ABQ0LDI0_MYCCL|nr:predicted protein [Mycena chlorophos]
MTGLGSWNSKFSTIDQAKLLLMLEEPPDGEFRPDWDAVRRVVPVVQLRKNNDAARHVNWVGDTQHFSLRFTRFLLQKKRDSSRPTDDPSLWPVHDDHRANWLKIAKEQDFRVPLLYDEHGVQISGPALIEGLDNLPGTVVKVVFALNHHSIRTENGMKESFNGTLRSIHIITRSADEP